MISNTRFTRKEERFQDKKIFTRKSPYVNANLFDINVKKKV